MLRHFPLISFAFRLSAVCALVVRLTVAAPAVHLSSPENTNADDSSVTRSVTAADLLSFQWNLSDKETPLLGVQGEHLKVGFDHVLTYRFEQLRFPIFQPLIFDEELGRFVLPALATDGTSHFVQFQPSDIKNNYSAIEAANIRLVDNDSAKTIRTSDGTRYLFVRYPDGEFRCACIREPSGAVLNLLYTANGLMLHGIVDGSGRSVTFNYGRDGISSVTQTWMAKLEGFTKTWPVGDVLPNDSEVKYAHTVSLKTLPANAIVRQYTAEMAASDKLLASIFGGPNAIAGGNGFEPAGLAASYPLYRGDVYGDDGIERRGHLSFAMHLYGNANGTGDSAIYVPAGFTSHSQQPTPTDAAVTFYYPKLGNFTDVTLVVFHVSDFQISNDGDRVRIGNLGGPGGSSPLYKHSHIEFYRGNTGLPPLAARAALRIDPAKVFAPDK